MKKVILGLLLATLASGAAYAVTTAGTVPGAYTPGKTPPVDFEALSKADKIKLIETKHAESVAKASAKWKAESDDDKIAKYQHRRQAFMARKNGAAAPLATPITAATVPAATQQAPVTTATPVPVK